MTAYDYQYIEEVLLRLLTSLLGVFSDSEKDEVKGFIDAGEYGLALETFVDVVVEEQKQIRSESLALVLESADAMQMDREAIDDKLRGHIADN